MQTHIEKLDGLKHKMTIDVDWDHISEKENQKINQVARTADISGFRKGKVPAKIVKQRYGASIRQEVLAKIVEETLSSVIEEKNIDFAGKPEIQFDHENAKEGEKYSFIVNYEVYPEFEVNELANQVITHVTAEVTEEDIDQTIEDLREQQADYQVADRPAENGDVVVIDFIGYLNGDKFEGGEAAGHSLKLGSGTFIPGFEEQIHGLTKGQQKTIEVTFPEDYHSEELAGKKVQFEVTVNEVKAPVLPELDDSFAEKFDIKPEDGGINQLRENLVNNLTNELSNKLKQINADKLFEMLYDNNQFELPEVLIKNEQEHMQQLRVEQLKRQFGSEEAFDIPLEKFQKAAERRVALSLMIKKLIEKYEIQPDNDLIDQLITERFGNVGDVQTIKNYFKSNKEFMQSLEFQALELQVINKLLENMQIKEEQQSFFEVMHGKKKA